MLHAVVSHRLCPCGKGPPLASRARPNTLNNKHLDNEKRESETGCIHSKQLSTWVGLTCNDVGMKRGSSAAPTASRVKATCDV